tara:strand:+ start:2856 stop:3725 length:870 start_codon:yes stop_codon:yes gene_type:complete
LGIVLLAFGIGNTLGVNSGRDEVSSREHYQNTKQDNLRACVGREGAAAIECVSEAIESAQHQSDSRQDLYAQQDMSRWAFWLLVLTVLTFAVTAIGVWFVKRTLDATLEAVEDTEHATLAMNEANEIARKTSALQLRPYMGTLGAAVIVEPHGQTIAVVIDIKNFGQTPAQIVAQDFRVVHFARQRDDYSLKRIFYRIPIHPTAHCDPGHTQSRTAIIDGPLNWKNGDHIFTELTQTYRSFDGKTFWRRMAYQMNHDSKWVEQWKIRMDVHEIYAEDGEGDPPPTNLKE